MPEFDYEEWEVRSSVGLAHTTSGRPPVQESSQSSEEAPCHSVLSSRPHANFPYNQQQKARRDFQCFHDNLPPNSQPSRNNIDVQEDSRNTNVDNYFTSKYGKETNSSPVNFHRIFVIRVSDRQEKKHSSLKRSNTSSHDDTASKRSKHDCGPSTQV